MCLLKSWVCLKFLCDTNWIEPIWLRRVILREMECITIIIPVAQMYPRLYSNWRQSFETWSAKIPVCWNSKNQRSELCRNDLTCPRESQSKMEWWIQKRSHCHVKRVKVKGGVMDPEEVTLPCQESQSQGWSDGQEEVTLPCQDEVFEPAGLTQRSYEDCC